MSLSSLLKEIEQKKLLVKSLKGPDKKSFLTRLELLQRENELDLEVVAIPKRKHNDDDEEKDTVEGEDVKRQKILRDLNEYKEKLKQEEIEEAASKISKEDQRLLDSIDDEELNTKLESFPVASVLPGESRLERIKRLNLLTTAREAKVQKLKQDLYEKSLDFTIVLEDIRDDTDKVYIQVRSYIKFLLLEWDKSIKSDDDTQQKLLLETKKNLVPLLSKLRQKSLSSQIFTSLATTFKYLQDKNYMMSNDSYLNLSIGNACWPIGVLNIGIHARSAHTRLAGLETISNIMSDEKTRAWLMSVKRLITFAEKKWPN